MWELDHKGGWVSKNWCFWTVVLEKTLESLRQQGDQTSQSWRKSALNIHWKDWCWIWNSNILSIWYEELTHWKTPWLWERLKAGLEGGNRGCHGRMASSTQWTWVWVKSGSWMDREAWRAAIHGVAKSRSRLSDWTELRLSFNVLWARCFKCIFNFQWVYGDVIPL